MKALLEALQPGEKDWDLAQAIDPARLPAHIAIIMDGNGRWAGRRFLPRVAGHKAGIGPVRTAVTDAGLEYESAEAAFLPTVEVDLDEDQAKRVFRLIEALEDSDDVQDVYANYSVPDEIMEKRG